MPRTARTVVSDAPHHVIQRGNRRQRVFFGASDYRAYLAVAAEEFSAAGVEVWAYCLMPNHVHLIVRPSRPEGLARAVGRTHLRYTRRINAREGWTGFLWQGRFASFAMRETHLHRCVRYIGLNPVRAGLVTHAADWPWSSVRALLGGPADPLTTPGPLLERLGQDLVSIFDGVQSETELVALRHAVRTNCARPLDEGKLSALRGDGGHVPEVHVPCVRPAPRGST